MDLHVDNKLVRKALANPGFAADLPARVLDGDKHWIAGGISGSRFELGWASGTGSISDVASGTEFFSGGLPSGRAAVGPYSLEGADDWAFLVEDSNGNLDQLLGDLVFTAPDLERYVSLLEKRRRRMSDIGIPYVFAVAPSKESIHPEHLPECSPAVSAPKLGAQLIEAATRAGDPIVDLHASLRERARAGDRLYHRRDTHWTYEKGAWIAAMELLDAVRANGVPAAQVDPGRIIWVEDPSERDLFDKPRVRFANGRLYPLEDGRMPDRERSLIPNRVAYGLVRVATPPALEVSSSRPTAVFANERCARAPRAMIYRDSFGTQLFPFVSLGFSWSAWLWRASVDMELIEGQRPDVVIQVIAERFLPLIPTDDVL